GSGAAKIHPRASARFQAWFSRKGQHMRSAYTLTDLGSFGGRYCQAYGINVAGQVVGMSWTSTQSPRAFLWQRGRASTLGKLRGRSSTAVSINDAGQVVGWMRSIDGEQHSFLCDGSSLHDLGTLGGSS